MFYSVAVNMALKAEIIGYRLNTSEWITHSVYSGLQTSKDVPPRP